MNPLYNTPDCVSYTTIFMTIHDKSIPEDVGVRVSVWYSMAEPVTPDFEYINTDGDEITYETRALLAF